MRGGLLCLGDASNFRQYRIPAKMLSHFDDIIKQSASDEAEEESNDKDNQSHWSASSEEHNLKTLKRLVKNTARHRFTELWDEENEKYTFDRKRQGELNKQQQ